MHRRRDRRDPAPQEGKLFGNTSAGTEEPCALVVFSRFDSRRLPGKALADLGGRPLLARVLDRLRLVRGAGRIVVATSRRPVDDPIAALAREERVPVFRGDDEDVLGRALGCAEAFGLERLVRICGDSPFIDPAIIGRVVDRFTALRPDMATNAFPRSFPIGCGVEVIGRDALRRAAELARTPREREHMTTVFYAHPERFRIVNVAAGHDRYLGRSIAIDTPGDLERARRVLERLTPGQAASLDTVLAGFAADATDTAEGCRA